MPICRRIYNPNTVGQYRTLTNAGIRATVSYVKGKNNIKAGIDFENTALSENDKFGIVNPTANAVCLNADGSFDTNPLLNNPAACGGVGNVGGTVNPSFIPLLGCYDLTRTVPLPSSDGCPAGQTVSGLYTFRGNDNIKESALYAQDTITVKNWSFNLGLRADIYRGISSAQQLEPRLGIAYNFKPTSTVLRVSYARTMETPFNENLILASTGCNDPVIFDLQESVPGGQCISSNVPALSPGHRNEFHAGLEQAFGKYLVVDGEYIWKYTHKAFDFSVLGNTPITYPIEWDSSKIPGYAIRASVPNYPRIYGVRGHVQRGGAFLYAAGQRHWRNAGYARGTLSISHRPRRALQSDHPLAISALEAWPVVRIQLALR